MPTENSTSRMQNQLQFDDVTDQVYYSTVEYNLVAKKALEGVYIVPSAENSRIWFGVLFIRRGIYLGGIFRFNLQVDSKFPDTNALPTITFDLDIFHPNIDRRSRIFDLSAHFPEGWNKNLHRLYQVLAILQMSFFKLDAFNEPSNHEAATLLKENRSKFRKMVVEVVRYSRDIVYDAPNSNDANTICFTPWNSSIHEPIRKKILSKMHTNEMSQASSSHELTNPGGFSWIDGDCLILRADNTKIDNPADNISV